MLENIVLSVYYTILDFKCFAYMNTRSFQELTAKEVIHMSTEAILGSSKTEKINQFLMLIKDPEVQPIFRMYIENDSLLLLS